MRTEDFISRYKDTTPEETRVCSSVKQFRDGNFYSYGSHYPLLFQAGGHWFVNDRGYSNSTSKHIGWASREADYHVELPAYNGSDYDLSFEAIKGYINDEIDRLREEATKHRFGTRVRESITDHIARHLSDLDELNEDGGSND